MMARRRNEISRTVFQAIIILLTLYTSTQRLCSQENLDPFRGLVEAVESSGEETLIQGLVDIVASDSLLYIPEDLADLVSECYADAVVPETVADGVLTYLSRVYKDHGYYETGNWATSSQSRVWYVPYQGELPKYDIKDFQMPVEGKLTSGYGYRASFGRFHRGIDVSLSITDTVRCALPGVVVKTGYEPRGYGRYVVVSHDGGIETLYGHLHRSLVDPGARLEAGSPLGLGGVTGNATGPHLHFETRYRGVALDPISWFNLTGRFKRE